MYQVYMLYNSILTLLGWESWGFKYFIDELANMAKAQSSKHACQPKTRHRMPQLQRFTISQSKFS